MNKLFTRISMALVGIAMAVGVGVAAGASIGSREVRASESVYKAIDFGNNSTTHSSYVNNYSSTFTATLNGFAMECSKINNGQSTSGWNHVRIGEKKNSGTATLSTTSAIDHAITKVVIDFSGGYSNKVTSTKLIMASNSSFTQNKVEYILASGGAEEKTITVTSPTTSRFYQIAVAYDSGASNNGETRIGSISFYHEVLDTQTINGSASYSTSIREDGSISLTTNASTATWSITSGSTYASLSDTIGKSVTLSGSNNGAGSVSLKAVASGYTDATATITINAKPVGTYYDITFNGGEHLSLPNDAETNVISGSDILWQLTTTAKHKFPVKANVSVTGTFDSWDYSDGLLEIENVGSDITITASAIDASVTSIVASGYKSSFDLNEPFSSEGLVVTGTYDDDINPHTSEALSSSLFDIDSSDFDNSAEGTYDILVSLKSDDSVFDIYEVTVADLALNGTYNITSKATLYDGSVTAETFKTKTNNSSIFTITLNKVRLYCGPTGGSTDVGSTDDIVLSAADAYITFGVPSSYIITRIETSASTKENGSIGTVTVGSTSNNAVANNARTVITDYPFTNSVTISTSRWIYMQYINIVVTKKYDSSAVASAYAVAFNELTHNECAALAGISADTWTKAKAVYDLAVAANSGVEETLSTASANKDGNDLAQAMFRYDLILLKYGKTNFLSRNNGNSGLLSASKSSINNSSTTLVIIVISAISLIAVSSYFVIRRRKENN